MTFTRKATPKKKVVIRGYVLHEGADFVVIATLRSTNGKTGNMVQVWILPRFISPRASVDSGADSIVCFDCIHRGTVGPDGRYGFKRSCYVNLRTPQSIWRAYQRGSYEFLPEDRYPEVFGERRVRFGAWGEPVLIPIAMVRAISAMAKGHTGYSHQWRRPEFQAYREYVMASCDYPADYDVAAAMGWRTFRARMKDQAMLPGEITCPASSEGGKRTQCIKCLLCDGSKGATDARKNITIIVHGSGAKNFVGIGDIRPAAAA